MEVMMFETGRILSGDERTSRRVQIALVTVRYPVAPAEFVVGDALDLSRGGMFIRASRPLPVGKLIPFEIRVVAEALPLKAIGRVMWTRTTSDGGNLATGMGVKFIDIDQHAHEVIGGLVSVREQTMYGIGPQTPEPPPLTRRIRPLSAVVGHEVSDVRPSEPSVPFLLVTKKLRRSGARVLPPAMDWSRR